MFELKGNYYSGNYNYPKTSGIQSVERMMDRKCPANTDETLWECPIEYKDVDKVIESSVAGFKTWRLSSLEDRLNILEKYKENLTKVKDQMARAIALETGKPLWESLTEANAVIGKVDVTIKHSLPRIQTKNLSEIAANTNGRVTYKPIGPSLIIGPFNFPCHLANTQILSSLISGNSIIFKPSEKTCYSAQIMFDCLANAGFPEGVVNLIQGDGEVARRIVSDKDVKCIFFTGSKEVGKKILENTSTDLNKMVALELGGKNTSILHHDANLDYALEELIKASFITSGQRCTSTSLIPIHRSILDEFVHKFHQVSKKIIVDHPIDFEVEPFMGPLVDKRSMDTFLLYVGMAKREGIEEIMRGKQIHKKFNGHYVSPSVHVASKFDSDSHFLASEIFGPTTTFIPYDDIEEAINIANATEYGLAASIFTKDKNLFELCVRDIDAGIINHNSSTCGASAVLPFGGVKNSGNYRPAAVAMIDSCVYTSASIEKTSDDSNGFESVRGINI